MAGECPGLLTWRGGAVTRPNLDGSACVSQPGPSTSSAEKTGEKLTYTREEVARLAMASVNWLGTVQYTVEYLVVSLCIASVQYPYLAADFRLGPHLLYQNLSGRQRRRWQHCQQFFVPLNITRSSCSGSSPPQRYRCLQTSI